jgi:hypothetical protein
MGRLAGTSVGLVDVSTANLEKALRHLHRGDLECPLTIVALTRIGLQSTAEPFLTALRGVDAVGVRAVLTAVLAERRERAAG